MKKEILKALGLNARFDIPSGEIFSPSFLPGEYGIPDSETGILNALHDFVAAYNCELPLDTESPIDNPINAARVMYPVLRNLDHEEAWVIFLSNRNTPICRIQLCRGDLSSTNIDKRRIVKEALDRSATGIILFHNHPSGTAKPSFSDIERTKELKNCLDVFDIQLTDHIIISNTNFYSFNDEGLHQIDTIRN